MAELRFLANCAQKVVPDLVGVSVARLDHGLTFTLVATAEEIAVLDGIQYFAGGPCVDAAHLSQSVELENHDALDEDRWRLFAQASAAHTVHTTLTLPLMTHGQVVGMVNLYAASPRAFAGHHDELAELFGAWAAGAVANADLAFTTRSEGEAAPDRVRKQFVIDRATSLTAAQHGIGIEAAEARLPRCDGADGKRARRTRRSRGPRREAACRASRRLDRGQVNAQGLPVGDDSEAMCG